MNLKECRERADAILGRGDADPEETHMDEDQLAMHVLAEVTKKNPEAIEMAWVVLDIRGRAGVTRWYA